MRPVKKFLEGTLKAMEAAGGVTTKGAIRQRLPKITQDFHVDTAGSRERGRFRKAVSTEEEEKQLSRMARDNLLHQRTTKLP